MHVAFTAAALAVRVISAGSGAAGSGVVLDRWTVATSAELVSSAEDGKVYVFTAPEAEPIVAWVEAMSPTGVAWLDLEVPLKEEVRLAATTSKGAAVRAEYWGRDTASTLRGRVVDSVSASWSRYSEFLGAGPVLVEAGPVLVRVLRTTFRVPPGALGAGVLDSSGKLVGILVGTIGSYGAVVSL
jgi:hypothetical protein